MTPVEILKAARELISNPARWTKGRYARTADGEEAWVGSNDATCFCGLGATMHVARDYVDSWEALGVVAEKRGYSAFSEFNDALETTHADVLTAFDEAIAITEADA